MVSAIKANRDIILKGNTDKNQFATCTWIDFIQKITLLHASEVASKRPDELIAEYKSFPVDRMLMEMMAVALHCDLNQSAFNTAIDFYMKQYGMTTKEAGIFYLRNQFLDKTICLHYLLVSLERECGSTSLYLLEKQLRKFHYLPNERPHNKFLFYKNILELTPETPQNVLTYEQEVARKNSFIHQLAAHVFYDQGRQFMPTEHGYVQFNTNRENVVSATISNTPYNIQYMEMKIFPSTKDKRLPFDTEMKNVAIKKSKGNTIQEFHKTRENHVIEFEVIEDVRHNQPKQAILRYVLPTSHVGNKGISHIIKAVEDYAHHYYQAVYATNDGISDASGAMNYSFIYAEVASNIQALLAEYEEKKRPQLGKR